MLSAGIGLSALTPFQRILRSTDGARRTAPASRCGGGSGPGAILEPGFLPSVRPASLSAKVRQLHCFPALLLFASPNAQPRPAKGNGMERGAVAQPPAGDAIGVPLCLGTSEGTHWPHSAGQPPPTPPRKEPSTVVVGCGKGAGGSFPQTPPRVRWGPQRKCRERTGDLLVLVAPFQPAAAASPKGEGDAEGARWVQR